MKKSLIALAALSATAAFAQNAITLDGAFDVGVQSIDYKGNRINEYGGNGSTTSQLNIRGTRDLSNGMKAMFRVETDWNTASNNANTGVAKSDGTLANGSTFANGEIRGGIAGAFGEVHVGALNNNSLGSVLTGEPYLTAIGAGFNTVIRAQSLGGVRMDNSVMYKSPSFSGFQVTVLQSNKQTLANTTNFSTTLGAYQQVGGQEFGLNYNAQGPLQVSLSRHTQDNDTVGTGVTKYNLTTLGANYAVTPDFKVYFLTQTNKADNSTVDTTFTSLAAAYTMGAHTISALAGTLQSNASPTAGKSTQMFSAGYTYAMDKGTDLYIRYENIDDGAAVVKAATIDGTGTVKTRFGAGLRLTF